MKPLNLREFAESLLLGQHREFAIEILDNLDFRENSNFEELCEDITRHSEKEFKYHEPIRQIDRIRDRLNLLDEIKDSLDKNGFSGDPDDEIGRLIETSVTLSGVLHDKGFMDTLNGDVVESVLQLLERVPAFDL